jgi:hypothetical protein
MVIVICRRGFSALFSLTTDLMGFQSKSVIHFRGRRKKTKKVIQLISKMKTQKYSGNKYNINETFSPFK